MNPCQNEPQIKDLNHSACKASLTAVQDALFVLNGKWKLPIIIALSGQTRRFGELQRLIEGISGKVLSHELKELEVNGFVLRHVRDTSPVTVEYELTEYSATLKDVVSALREWGMNHRERIKKEW